MEHNLSNSYANAMDVILSNEEKLRLIRNLNETLPDDLKLPIDTSVATSSEQFIIAVKNAGLQLGRIMFSSGFNPWAAGRHLDNVPPLIRELNNVATFEEFHDMYNKLTLWFVEYDRIIKTLHDENNGR